MKHALFIIGFTIAVLFSVQVFPQTFEMIDINPEGSSVPMDLFTHGNRILFSAYTDGLGYELWITDGTSDGTNLLKDINIDGSSEPSDFIEYQGDVIFSAATSNNSYKIWLSDGTTEGTRLIKNSDVSWIENRGGYIEYHDLLFFSGSGQLWYTDGTEDGTIKIKNISSSSMIKYNDMLIFRGYESNSGLGSELYKSDGTEDGTVLIKDIRPEGSPPDNSSHQWILWNIMVNYTLMQVMVYMVVNYG